MAYHVGCQRREPRSHADHARDDSASPVRKRRHGRDPDLAEEAAMTGATYDLVIRGGRVIDPAQGLDGALDVPVRDGRVAAVGARLSPADAREVIDARGRLVLPGLIDTHAHVYQYVTGRFGLEPDMVGVH